LKAGIPPVHAFVRFGAHLHAQSATSEAQARKAVESFYDAFNFHDFARVPSFTTEDWVHINLLGGWTRGRDNVLKELKEVHSTFLKGVTAKPEVMEVRFASTNVAIVTVPSKMSPYTTPDGLRREDQRQIRTFVLVQRDECWLIMQDHNTFIEEIRRKP
jgi:uncharacterized protein (TIGR02246 family)